MKIINCSDWAPCPDLSVDLEGLLELYFAHSPERLAWFYYRLGEFVIYGFLNEALSLGGDYFNESD